MRILGLLLVAMLLTFGSSQSFAQQDRSNEWLHCEINGQVATLGLYDGYAYFRLKDDPRVFIFFKVKPDAVAPRMALLQTAYISGSTVCFMGATLLSPGEIQISIPQIIKNFNTTADKIVVPMMPDMSLFPAGTKLPH